MDLTKQKCTACYTDMPTLTAEETNIFLAQIPKWLVNKAGHLYREYHFQDFQSAMNFANKIGEIAEAEGHHPDLKIAWGLCAVEMWTHKINGLSESDFILAAKIEALWKN